MTASRVDFRYEVSDERLIAYSRLPVLDRLKWLDEIRRFTLAVRAAPIVATTANPETTWAAPDNNKDSDGRST